MGDDRAVGCNSQVPELDALRGIGAVLILGYHLRPVSCFFGWTRADLFFVISGYLITRVILRHGSGQSFLVRFWARRLLRIIPPYYLMLAILVIVNYHDGNGNSVPKAGLIAHATFTQNLPYYWAPCVPYFPPAAIQSWSLAIEEQFYLVWPLLAVLWGRMVLVPAAIWLVVVSIVMRLEGMYAAVALARADGLALGTILAVFEDCYIRRPAGSDAQRVMMRRRSAKLSWSLGVIGMFGLLFISGPLPRYEEPIPGISGCGPWSIFGVNLVYFSCVGLVVLNTGHYLLGILRLRLIRYIGHASYGIYLYNYLVIDAVQNYCGYRSLTIDLAAAVLSILAGIISWEFMEKPIGNLRCWIPYRSA